MKRIAGLISILIVTAIASAVVSSHFARKHATEAIYDEFVKNEVSNSVRRFKNWECIESYLVNGRSEEALELTKSLRSSELALIAMYLEHNHALKKALREHDPTVEAKVAGFEGTSASSISLCK